MGDGAGKPAVLYYGGAGHTLDNPPGYIKQLFVGDFYKKVFDFPAVGVNFDNIYFVNPGDEPETVVSI